MNNEHRGGNYANPRKLAPIFAREQNRVSPSLFLLAVLFHSLSGSKFRRDNSKGT